MPVWIIETLGHLVALSAFPGSVSGGTADSANGALP